MDTLLRGRPAPVALPPMLGGDADSGACTCIVAVYEYPHTGPEHDAAYCGGWTWDPPCGGCYDCIIAQIAYGCRDEPQAFPVVLPPMVRRPPWGPGWWI
jgi:hypothetical protein